MKFADTLWLFKDETLKVMLAETVAYYNDSVTDPELTKSCQEADAMRADLETALAKRGATWTLRPDGTFEWH